MKPYSLFSINDTLDCLGEALHFRTMKVITSYQKPCLPPEVQEKCIIHIEEEVIQLISMKLGLFITSAAFRVALDELKRIMMCISFLYLILFKTSVEHKIIIFTDMGSVLSQQEESSYERSIGHCSEVQNFYQRSYPMSGRERLPTEVDPDEKITLYCSGDAIKNEDCLSRLPAIALVAFFKIILLGSIINKIKGNI
ncbi:hypothetical protein DSO57_1002528 [Entomophthora muscae]|uniref:Uncharacterized protein n=1 Tax=Entomophthora muscae TaxID=34485 RepID=A0ACC2SLS1_9FUNG|nr:hypothetical protein DSO57_1002528 [Entomophthora muscae]